DRTGLFLNHEEHETHEEQIKITIIKLLTE
ncbi:hypothetical protein LCGC14_2847830, partial [marine sediment metagenome]